MGGTGRGRRGALLAVCLLLASAACASPTGDERALAGDLDLSGYAPCAPQPDPPELADVPGLVLPPEATAFSQQTLGPLTQVEGVVALTPLQARAFYESHPDLEVISVEDERAETEVVVSDGTNRLFVKVQIVCAVGSNFAATVGPEIAADQLPTPAGGLSRGGW